MISIAQRMRLVSQGESRTLRFECPQLEAELDVAEETLAEAVASGDADLIAEATAERDQCRDNLDALQFRIRPITRDQKFDVANWAQPIYHKVYRDPVRRQIAREQWVHELGGGDTETLVRELLRRNGMLPEQMTDESLPSPREVGIKAHDSLRDLLPAAEMLDSVSAGISEDLLAVAARVHEAALDARWLDFETGAEFHETEQERVELATASMRPDGADEQVRELTEGEWNRHRAQFMEGRRRDAAAEEARLRALTDEQLLEELVDLILTINANEELAKVQVNGLLAAMVWTPDGLPEFGVLHAGETILQGKALGAAMEQVAATRAAGEVGADLVAWLWSECEPRLPKEAGQIVAREPFLFSQSELRERIRAAVGPVAVDGPGGTEAGLADGTVGGGPVSGLGGEPDQLPRARRVRKDRVAAADPHTDAQAGAERPDGEPGGVAAGLGAGDGGAPRRGKRRGGNAAPKDELS